MSCCGTLYQLDPEIGRRIARGEQVEIAKEQLTSVNAYGGQSRIRRCSNCGFTTEEDYTYCPKCGSRL
jgi:rubrerythrin